MNRWAKLCIYLLIVTTIICGTVMIYLRGVIPDTSGWSISQETAGYEYIRTETGLITQDYLGQYISIVTARQQLEVFVDDDLILSSRDYGYIEPVEARFTFKVEESFIGKEMRIVFTTTYPGDNLLMREALSFQRINPGLPEIDYSITAVSIMSGIAALILAFAFGIRNPGSLGIGLFALMNFALAFNITRGESVSAFEALNPRMLLVFTYIMFYTYMLPLLLFFYITLTGVWKKCAFVLILSPILYSVTAVILNMVRVVPFMLTDSGYNYVLSLSITLMILMMALQTREKNRFSIIARLHLVLWTAWGISAATRLLVFNMTLQVNVEYRLMYSFTLVSLTFFGIYSYAERIRSLQESEQILSIKTESLIQNYEQVNTHLREVNSLKHDIKNHLTALHLLLKNNRYDDAQAYLKKYTDEVGEVTEAAFHGNYLINAIIYDMMKKAKALDIETELNLKASPLSISEPDLVSLLTNITDNALEACAKLPEGQKRFINLSITRREPYLAIVCENSNPGGLIIETDDEKGNKIISNKREKGHGHGLQTIERVTSSYEGIMEITYNDEMFTITIALKDV